MRQPILLVLLLCAPATAWGFSFATDTGDDTGIPLHWAPDDDESIGFEQHVLGHDGIPAWLLHASARSAFASWAEVPSADVDFEERYVFAGTPCPHAIPNADNTLIEQVCGGPIPPHDFKSALYFIETTWPFGEEVIALTTLSWAEGGVLVDADVAYNGLDYEWSVFEDEVLVDFESITLHELGHFLGLAHSTAPGAVMRVDYDEGNVIRELGQDDMNGVSALYPCSSGNCIGDVGHVAQKKCSAAGAGSAGVVALLLVALAAAWRRETKLGVPAALLAGAALLVPASGTSSTVLGLTTSDLAARADRVVRARVASVEAYEDRLVRSSIELEVLEDLVGGGSDRVWLDQPGGVMEDRGTLVFGMPRFVEGTEVVVFLADDAPIGTRVVGLAQGAFEVRGGELSRDTSGLMLARVGGHRAPAEIVAPETLEELRVAIR